MFASRVRRLTLAVLMGGVLCWFGCPTPPKQAPRITVLDPAPPVATTQPAQVVTVEGEPVIQPPRERPGSILPEENLNLPSGVVPLASWARLCGFDELRVLNPNYPRSIELRTGENTLALTIGQRIAKWNGVLVNLGFAPAMISGEVGLHSLDVRKNVYPLSVGRFPSLRSPRVLVIDPGHGGADPGSRGTQRGAIEKDLTLDWALRIEKLLAQSNWRVVLTRNNDKDLSLADRIALAERVQGDLFISLHFNSLPLSGSGGDETGIETYCLTPAGMPSTVNRDFEDDARKLYPNNRFDAENLLLAMRLHSALVKNTGQRDRGVRRARFMTVLREQNRPAVLIEGGFLSTPSEANLILRPDYRQLLAQSVVGALPE